MLLTEARVLLLYDPTRGVDVGTKGEIFQLMRDLAAKGYAILFHSSDLPELVHVADRVLVMRDGRVAATLDGDRISEEAILGAAMLERGGLTMSRRRRGPGERPPRAGVDWRWLLDRAPFLVACADAGRDRRSSTAACRPASSPSTSSISTPPRR